MKKILFCALVALISLTCAAKGDKVLVAYFSASGTTKSLATDLAKATGADVLEIVLEQPYTEEDLNFSNQQARAMVDMRNKDSRPEIKTVIEKPGQYGTIYLGFPIWGNAAPTVINSFIEKNKLKDVTVIAFSTSGSSDITNSFNLLKEAYPNLDWKQGTTLKRNPTEQDRQNVINTLKNLLESK